MIPKKIKIEMNILHLEWDDGVRNSIKLANLRYNCPCAFCTEDKNKKGKGYIPLYNNNEMTVTDIKTIGNYAIGITWKDGHNTGIYNFDYLRNLSATERKPL